MPQNSNAKKSNNELTHLLQEAEGDVQTLAKKLANYKSSISAEQKEAIKEARWRRFFTKLVGYAMLGLSAILAAWEFTNFVYQRYEDQHEANMYYKVAQSVFLEENNPEVALTFLNKALELDSDSEYRFFKTYIEGLSVVKILLNLDRPYSKKELDSAHLLVAEVKLMKIIEPEREEPYILLGQLYAALGESKKAILELEKAIQINPKNSYAHLRYGVALFEIKKIDEAKKELDLSLAIDDSKWAYLWHGVIEAQISKDFDKARSFYQKALEKDVKFDLALYNLAWSYMLQKERDYSKAKAYLEQVLKINPDYKEAYYAMGMLYGYQNKYETAKVYLTQALQKDTTYTTAYKWRAIVNSEVKLYDEAIEDLTKAISISPENIDLYTRRAGIYQKNQNFDKAINDLLYAMELKPNDKKTLFYLANLYRDTNQTSKALELYENAIAMDSDNEDIFAQRAHLFEKTGNLNKALDDYKSAIEISKYKPERHMIQRAKLNKKAGNIEEVIADLEKILTLNEKQDESLLMLSQILYEKGEFLKSKKLLKSYLELKPQDNYAVELETLIDKRLQSNK